MPKRLSPLTEEIVSALSRIGFTRAHMLTQGLSVSTVDEEKKKAINSMPSIDIL